ncbi:putative transposase of IS4/5 family (DUF4096) [Prauserella aidingensis]|nr:putative transposase of IS4/5 family (DUF4096) [Prauserella aidingensis]
MVEAIIYQYRTGIAWRDLPEVFGPWQTVWTWHRRLATEGTWDAVLAELAAAADAAGLLDSSVSVDSTIAGASARGECRAPCRGLDRITRSRPSSRVITRSAACAAGCRRRSTSLSTGAAPGRVADCRAGRGFADAAATAATTARGPPAGTATHPTRRGAGRQGLPLPSDPLPPALLRDHSRDPRTRRSEAGQRDSDAGLDFLRAGTRLHRRPHHARTGVHGVVRGYKQRTTITAKDGIRARRQAQS